MPCALRCGDGEGERLLVVRLCLRRERQTAAIIPIAQQRAQPVRPVRLCFLLFIRQQPRELHIQHRRQIFQRPDRRRCLIVFDLREHITRDPLADDLRLRHPARQPRLLQLLSQRHFWPSVNYIYLAYSVSHSVIFRKQHRINS